MFLHLLHLEVPIVTAHLPLMHSQAHLLDEWQMILSLSRRLTCLNLDIALRLSQFILRHARQKSDYNLHRVLQQAVIGLLLAPRGEP